MVKTVRPGSVDVPGVGSFVANAVPDPFDARDLEYRSRLQPLPASLDERGPGERHVLHQEGQSCTGHAVAALINTVLASAGATAPPRRRRAAAEPPPRVSPYMLYRLGRRYDEFAGDEDAGSSLRAVFKGWFHHGVALEQAWPRLDMSPEPQLDNRDSDFARQCASRPLGAYYRVNPFRLDDMQSAINELQAIAVSAVIHDGWVEPVRVRRGKELLHVIARRTDSRSLGGHAFVLAGYNEVGFLVQNSWGAGWGKGGFATLPYEDWLLFAYDAWVARPGVPQTPFATGWNRTATGTGERPSTGRGPDLRRLETYVVNLGNDGRLSGQGRFATAPAHVDRAFAHMATLHDAWAAERPGSPRHVVLYAHGGLISESDGLEIAQRQLNWWLNNRVYPISFAWQSGPIETLLNQLWDLIKGWLPFGGVRFDLAEQVDRRVEGEARERLAWMWDEMKENARAASAPLDPSVRPIAWSSDPAAVGHLADQPGASLVVDRLRQYVEQQGADRVRVHLVGHSAGAIFHAALLGRLREAGLRVDSVAFLAPALRVDEFAADVLPHLGPGGTVGRFATFALSDQLELDDTCPPPPLVVYNKSLLYLVSRAMERLGRDRGEVALLGMQRFLTTPGAGGLTLQGEIEALGGECVFAPQAAPDHSRSKSTTHGGFDDDEPTMTSVVMRVLGAGRVEEVEPFAPHAALRLLPGVADEPAPVAAERPTALRAGRPPTGRGARRPSVRLPQPPTQGEAPQPLPVSAEVATSGVGPVVETAESQDERPVAPAERWWPVPEVADAPRTGSAVVDVLLARDWTLVADGQPARRSRRGARPARPAAGR
jgi:hypothetical protein